MLKFKIHRLLFQALILLFMLNLNDFTFAEDICSDDANSPGLPTFTQNTQHPENWFSKPVIKTSQDTIERNSSVEVWITLSGWGSPPYQWEVSGSGFHFNDIDGPAFAESKSTSTRLILWADGTACGTAEITVTDSKGNHDIGFVRGTAGYWAFKGNYCGLSGNITCSTVNRDEIAQYTLIKGNKKQYQETRLIRDHRIHPSQGQCQYCDDFYANHPCGSDSVTSDEPNCIDGDHQVPGYDCCSTNYYWCDFSDGCRSDFAPNPDWGSTGECVTGDNRWMADVQVACVNKSGGVVRLLYYEWECS